MNTPPLTTAKPPEKGLKIDPKNLAVANRLESYLLPKVLEAQRRDRLTWPHESGHGNEEILKAGIAYLRGENPHLSGFISGSTLRWQGAEFVVWIKEILESHLTDCPALSAKEVLEWLTPFLLDLRHHKDLPQEIE